MNLKLNFLDHIAITVHDLEISARWYEEVLGLKRYVFPNEWGPYPVFMLAGKSGLALFPMKSNSQEVLSPGKNYITMKHFAFNVDHENFEFAKQKLDQLQIPFEYQDHIFFDSIYMRDPDGYQVELTTIKVDEQIFYGS